MNEPQDPKIIVDEDWKSRAQREKEELEQAQKEQPEPEAAGEIPPASFSLLVSSLIHQAMISLGQAPDPIENKGVVRLDLAKHHIDTLGVLEEKTAGNLTDEESQLLTTMLHQLRMLFVTVQANPQAATSTEAPEEPQLDLGQ